MRIPSKWQLTIGLTVALAGIALTGYEQDLLAALFGLLGVLLMIGALRPPVAHLFGWRWLRVPADEEAGSRGISLETMRETFEHGDYWVIAKITPQAELPQPLRLRIRFSAPVKYVACSFYKVSGKFEVVPAVISVKRRGKTASIAVVEPKLAGSSFLSVTARADRPLRIIAFWRL